MILRSIAKMLLHEHRYKPICGRVLCLGPQQVPMHRGEVDALFAPSAEEAREALARWRVAGSLVEAVSDEYLFRKFAIDSLDSLDVVPGFGGTIIHDLNTPIAADLYEQFDFILDGGTFDHLVNVGIAFESVIRMLRPGGRVFHYNAASGYLGAAYVTFGPDLFYDYYVVNKFEDCKVYVTRETSPHPNAPWDVFYLPDGRTKHLNSGLHQMVVCIAEKAADSRSNAIPVEYSYRSQELRQEYAIQRSRMLKSKRPVLSGDRPRIANLRATMARMSIEARYVVKRYRAGKFDWAKFRRNLARHQAGASYAYVGRI